MFRIYCDRWHVENAFTDAELADAVTYWQQHGKVTIKEAAQVVALS